MKSKGCYICGSNDNLYIDHCHDTGNVRGCLYSRHNTILGLMGDNLSNVRKEYEGVVAYLIGCENG